MCPPTSVKRVLTDSKRSLKLLELATDFGTRSQDKQWLSFSLLLPLPLLVSLWHMRKGRGVNEMGLSADGRLSAGPMLDPTRKS